MDGSRQTPPVPILTLAEMLFINFIPLCRAAVVSIEREYHVIFLFAAPHPDNLLDDIVFRPVNVVRLYKKS